MKTVTEAIEFLHNVEKSLNLIRELSQNLKVGVPEKRFPVYYKSHQKFPEVFSVFFSNEKDFNIQKEFFLKEKMCHLIISQNTWKTIGGVMEPAPVVKVRIECLIIDIRKNFLLVKITNIINLI